jgi:acetolactate synthase-1/2/3 large subunit
MTAAQLLVKCLENEGVEYIFGIPGEENIDIMDALLDSSMAATSSPPARRFMLSVYRSEIGAASHAWRRHVAACSLRKTCADG